MFRGTLFLLGLCLAGLAVAAPKTYPIGIESTPTGAEIFIDGKSVGYTPYKGKVAEGTHDLVLKRTDYDDLTTKLVIDKSAYKKTFTYSLIKAVILPTIDVQARDASAESAQVFIDGTSSGTIPMTSKLPVGRHFIEVKKDGFVTYSEWVDLKEGGTSTLSVQLDEIKKPATLTVEGTKDAQIYIDGVLKGNIPSTVDNVDLGRHLVEVKLDGFVPFAEWVEFASGTQKVIKAELTPAAPVVKVGSIRVFTNQDPAEVYLDGTPIGVTPLTYESVAPGPHFIQIKKAGYFTFEQNFEAKVNERTLINATLTLAGPKAGSVRIISPVVDASVYIDGNFIGKVPVLKEDLSIGNHILLVKAAGYADWTKNIEINGTDSLEFTAELMASGTIRLLSNLAGAEIFIDGEKKTEVSLEEGKPLLFENVPVGKHKVMIRLNGYVDAISEFNVNAGETATADLKLIKVADILSPEDRRKRIATYGSRAIRTGDFAADLMAGTPYLEATVITGIVDKIDVGVSLRIAGVINEIGARGKYTLLDTPSFGIAAEGGISGGFGPSLTAQGDGSNKLSFTSNTVGAYGYAVASLFLRDIAAVSMRGGFNLYTDAGPTLDSFAEVDENGVPTRDQDARDRGARLMTGLVVQLLQKEKMSYNFILEGNPAGIGSGESTLDGDKRRLMYDTVIPDLLLYFRGGITLKF
jgi:hypothetical protein